MSVETQLGVDDPSSELLGLARVRWAGWVRESPSLGVVGDLLELRDWTRQASRPAADGVLLVLARLASPTGADDVAAAAALAWMLAPGAAGIAHRLQWLTPRIDEVVAAQLWVEVRSFNWRGGWKVAANILMNTRKGVLRDLERGEQLRCSDPTWSRAVSVDPDDLLWERLQQGAPDQEEPAARELVEVLRWAVRSGVVAVGDAELLVRLAQEADRVDACRTGRGRLGLMDRVATEVVGRELGVSGGTVRRRARLSLDALSGICVTSRGPGVTTSDRRTVVGAVR